MACALGLMACGGDADNSTGDAQPVATAAVSADSRLPVNAGFDYQLGTPYDPGVPTAVIVRDRTAAPDPQRATICYVNGFQTQPGEAAQWAGERAGLVLRDADGAPLFDPEWPDEMILDISTADTRDAIAAVVGDWIDGCAADGFAAVEIDNLDTFTRFPDRISVDDAIAFATLLAERAHAAGLWIGQKNTAELAPQRRAIGFDFAIVEQCGEYDECEAFTDAFGQLAFLVEYDAAAFDAVCARHPELAVVLRDRDLVGPGEPGYVRRWC